MPARDKYHGAVRNALIKDGWTITSDLFHSYWDDKDSNVYSEGERIIAAEKVGRKIAVEITKFLHPLPDDELEHAIDLLGVYRSVLVESKSAYVMYLAMPEEVYKDVFKDAHELMLLEKVVKQCIIFDPVEEEIVQWIS